MVMQSDLRQETLITLSAVAEHLPARHGRKIHYSTIFRWATKGVSGRVLPSVKIGGIRYTTVEALSHFVDDSALAAPHPVGIEELSAVNQALNEAGL
jgi:hypothetical protein